MLGAGWQGGGPIHPSLYCNLGEILRSLNITQEAAVVLEEGQHVSDMEAPLAWPPATSHPLAADHIHLPTCMWRMWYLLCLAG